MASTEHHLNDLRMSVFDAQNKWLAVAELFSLAYTKAYNKQQDLLKKIKQAQEAARKREEAMMGFTLLLLTGGIVGPMTQRFLGKALPSTASTVAEAAKDASKDSLLTEWTKHAVTELAKAGDEKLRGVVLDATKPSQNGSPFKPVGLTPLEFTLKMKSGIRERAITMREFAAVWHRSLGHLSPGQAEQFKKAVFATSFFSEIPSHAKLRVLDLQTSAELMLWIAWARVRDEEYWEKTDRQAEVFFSAESWDWAPLLTELQRLGAPVAKFSTNINTVDALHRPVNRNTINMTNFIKWSRSNSAVSIVYKNLPSKIQSMPEIEKQFKLVSNHSKLQFKI